MLKAANLQPPSQRRGRQHVGSDNPALFDASERAWEAVQKAALEGDGEVGVDGILNMHLEAMGSKLQELALKDPGAIISRMTAEFKNMVRAPCAVAEYCGCLVGSRRVCRALRLRLWVRCNLRLCLWVRCDMRLWLCGYGVICGCACGSAVTCGCAFVGAP